MRISRREIVRAMASWFLVTGIAGSLPLGSFAQAPVKTDSRFDAARAAIRQVMDEKQIPSVSVAVAKGGRIVWEEGLGWADREKMMRATPDTLYSLASISKPFTATALMRLVEQGKIDLDEPANEYLGAGKLTGLAGDASTATIRRVLSHTAGLPLHYQFFYNTEPYLPPAMDETISRYGILVTPPGEAYEYSNLGFGILDHIITLVSGRAYADFMRTEVFAPLGLLHTSVDIGPGLEAYAAQRYDSQERPIPFYTFDHNGGSAIYSSAHDLVRFGMFHLKDHLPDQQAILKDSTIDQIHETATPPVPAQPGLGYGLGWITQSGDHGHKALFHTGGMPGVNTALVLYPSEDVAVVVLTNKYGGSAKMMEAIVGAILPTYAEEMHKHEEQVKQAKAEPYKPIPELVGEWTGSLRTWEKKMPFSLVFQQDGDIHVKLGEELETLLNEGTFRSPELEGRFAGEIPTPDAKRHPHSVFLHLRLRGTKLNGQATAITTEDPVHYALTSYVELEKKGASH